MVRQPQACLTYEMKVLLLVLLTAAASSHAAEFHIANIFADNMVMQRDQPIAFWGKAKANTQITANFAGETSKIATDANGRWKVTFPARPASFDPLELAIEIDGQGVKGLKNILIGEVWLCGGQSNMAPSGHDNYDLEFPAADSEFVRYTRVESRVAEIPADDLQSREHWAPLVAGKMEERRIAPVAYYFGVRLQRFLKVPVGIINTAVGGTTAEVWASRASLEKHQELAPLIEQRGKDIGAFFNGAIAPLAELPIRGVLFYQGENNTFDLYDSYALTFPAVIESWRNNFNDQKLPFGIISLAGNKGMAAAPEPERSMTHRHSYTHIRDTHFRTHRSTPHTGLISIHDLGADDMHPQRKRDVGERAARWALAQVYRFGKKEFGKGGVYHMAPIYREMKVEGDRALLFFDYDPSIHDTRAGKTYKRLPVIDRAREFRGFVIAGADQRFFPAQVKIRQVKDGADIKDECLEVWSEHVQEPKAVRYAWENQPNANAWGLRGLPVAPFRTDDWPFITPEPDWAHDLEARRAANEKLMRRNEAWRRERLIEEARKVLKDLDAE